MSRADFTAALKALVGSEAVLVDAPLAHLTTWRVGGAARWLCAPPVDRVAEVLSLARSHGVASHVLGRGSNVLIDDAGIPGLVILTRDTMRNMSVQDAVITAEAGVPLPVLARTAADGGFGGYEFLIGIPGTVGAGVAINAGLTAKRVRDVAGIVIDAEIATSDGRVETWDHSHLLFRYRGSAVLDERAIVLRARFALSERSDAETIRRATAAHLRERRRKQPLSRPTAGSTFKQPSGGPAAGALIDRAGLKGARVGGASVSHTHANWIETEPGATAANVRALIAHVQTTVLERFGLALEREVRYLPDDGERRHA